MDYSKAERLYETARCRQLGKPIANNTRIFKRESYFALRFHGTDIVLLHKDGTVDICTTWKTQSTLARICKYTSAWVCTERLPSYNQRRPNIDRYHFLHVSDQQVCFSGVNDYIRINPNGRIDLNTVKAINVEVIIDKKLVRDASSKIKTILKQVLLRKKLGLVFEHRGWDFTEWALRFINVPLNQINYDDAPIPSAGGKIFDPGLDRNLFRYARAVNATKTIQIKELSFAA